VHNYAIKSAITVITSHFSTSAEYCGNIRILQGRANSAAQLEISRPVENCLRYNRLCACRM